MKFFKSRLFTILVTILLCFSLMGGIVLATNVFDQSYPATANIVVDDPGLTVYADGACTQELVTVDFGTIITGDSYTDHYWVKNTGTRAFTNVTVSSDLNIDQGTVTATTPYAYDYSIGGVTEMVITFDVATTANGGQLDFNIIFSCSYD